jgi:hypothetical protein
MHDPFTIAKAVADAARMNTTVTVRVFRMASPEDGDAYREYVRQPVAFLVGDVPVPRAVEALDYKISGDGTVVPPDGYEAIIEDGHATGLRKAA